MLTAKSLERLLTLPVSRSPQEAQEAWELAAHVRNCAECAALLGFTGSLTQVPAASKKQESSTVVNMREWSALKSQDRSNG